jgi:hypothetical protein
MLQHQNRTASQRKACDVGPSLPHVGICWTTRGYATSVGCVGFAFVVGSDSCFDDRIMIP